MDRNPSPPPPSCDQEDEEDLGSGDRIGNTVYSKHWLFGVLSGLIQTVTPESVTSGPEDEEEQVELAEEMENEICRVWDMSTDEDVALFLQEFKAPDIFMGVLTRSRCPRLREICVGILGNMACFREICESVSKCEDHGQVLLQCLCDSDPPTLLETCRQKWPASGLEGSASIHLFTLAFASLCRVQRMYVYLSHAGECLVPTEARRGCQIP
ncbi:rCG54201 [Rattus norvegicus]|uniref:RCG54201 n=1 Tax=Rattus norvegicus TaxID=10116 RepID=A6JBC4_RAT|nr:rCG54201 [Rattus norvegicus]